MRGLLYKLPQNIAACFKDFRFLWHIGAFALTYIISTQGLDWAYFNFFQNSSWQRFFFPAVIAGFFVPVIIPLSLIAIGAVRKNSQTLYAGFAIAQAAFLGWLLSSFYKAITGRLGPPERVTTVSSPDVSQIFHFGFWRGGIFWGWPSSHTTVAFAIGVTVFILFREHKIARYLAILYAVYIGFGVSTNIHWLSDVVAGAIFGSLVGIAVGTSFRNRREFGES
jgi:membrane-associated phospholipid phosphatase